METRYESLFYQRGVQTLFMKGLNSVGIQKVEVLRFKWKVNH